MENNYSLYDPYSRPFINHKSSDILKHCHNLIKHYNINKDNKIFTKDFFERIYEFVLRLLKTNLAKNVPDEHEKYVVAEWIMDSFVKYFFKNNPVIDNLQAYIRRVAFARTMAYIQSKYKKEVENTASFEELLGNGEFNFGEDFIYSRLPLPGSELDNLSCSQHLLENLKEELSRKYKKAAPKYLWIVLYSSLYDFYYIEKFFKKDENKETLLKIYSIVTLKNFKEKAYD
jgi:hypothetical protein